MNDFHLAQFNIGRFKTPLDHPEMAEFVALLDPVNALADTAPGFVWRYTTEGANDAIALRPYAGDDQIAINMSVWRSREELWEFVYRSGHLDAVRRRHEWFDVLGEIFQVLWWIPAGHLPTVEEGMERLALLRTLGPTPRAFTFRSPFESGVAVG
jgi:hypothetical protein